MDETIKFLLNLLLNEIQIRRIIRNMVYIYECLPKFLLKASSSYCYLFKCRVITSNCTFIDDIIKSSFFNIPKSSLYFAIVPKQMSEDQWKQFIQEVSNHLSTAKPSDDEELCKNVSALVQQLQPEKTRTRRYYYSFVILYSNMLLQFQNFI